MGKSGSSRNILNEGGESGKMKLLSLAICSLGIWVVLNSLVEGIWDDIVFGAIAAVLAVMVVFIDTE